MPCPSYLLSAVTPDLNSSYSRIGKVGWASIQARLLVVLLARISRIARPRQKQ